MPTTNPRVFPPLVIFGGGNMGSAIVRGGARGLGPLHDGAVLVVEPDRAKHEAFNTLRVPVVPSVRDCRAWLEAAEAHAGLGAQMLLAIKPQSLRAFAAEFRETLGVRTGVMISILAGTPSEAVREALGGSARIVRAMPNLAATIRQGTTAICLGAGSKPGDEAMALAIFKDVGQLVVSIDESMMDAFTAVAGSGPAYVFHLAESMVKAAVKLGFEGSLARDIVRETIAGAGNLLAESSQDPGTLRAAVTSKGGTTEAAVEVLERRAVREAIVEALRAARDRGVELGGQQSGS